MSPIDQTRQSAQGYVADERNAAVLIHLNGRLVPRDAATISVFDSGFVLGDGIWEGLRLVDGRIVALDAHIDRLFEAATALRIDIGLTRGQLADALHETLSANAMTDGVHIRLMITRGRKSTPNQDPRFVTSPATVVIIPEYKTPRPDMFGKGLTLFTSSIRCSPPDMFDLQLNTHSRLNLIQALLHAIAAGADEALMLDPLGFVGSCNSTNFFIVRNGELWTSTGRYSFNGITRGRIIALAREARITVHETDFPLTRVYSACEAFVTGTLAGVMPVRSVDGHDIGGTLPGPITARLRSLYEASLRTHRNDD